MTKCPPDDLLFAIARGESLPTDAILSSGVDVNAFGDHSQRTLLLAAAYAGRSDLIRELVRRGALVDLGNAFEGPALHIAAGNGHLDAVKTLLDLGANLEAETAQGTTALMAAAAWGHRDVVDLLLAKGANVHHRDHRGLTVRMIALEKEEDKIAAVLGAAESAAPN